MSVFVVGALHLDVVVRAPSLPRIDETLMGSGVDYVLGGKGGNQAVAAARMGASVAMAGRVGEDGFGAELTQRLEAAGVNTSQVVRGPGASGMSAAIVDAAGDYGAVVVSGENLEIDPSAITLPPDSRVLLLQNEIPAPVNLAAAQLAHAAGAQVIMNAAPARAADPALMPLVDLLVVNRVEAEDLTGEPDPKTAAKILATMGEGPERVIVTLGGDGAIFADDRVTCHMPAHPVEVASTHGAGDMYLGALASELDAGLTLSSAMGFASKAAALYVSTPVADRPGLTRGAVEAFQTSNP